MFRNGVGKPPTEVLPGVNTLVKVAIPAPRYAPVTHPVPPVSSVSSGVPGAPGVPGPSTPGGQAVTALLTALAPAAADLLELPSRVEDVDHAARRHGAPRTTLYVAAPRYPGDLGGPEPGSACRVIWPTPNGIYTLPTRYEGRRLVGPAVRAWRLAVAGPVQRVQRRRYFRVPWIGPVTLEVTPPEDLSGCGRSTATAADGLQVLTGTTVDLSEGGLRVTLPAPGLPDRTAIRVLLPVRDQVLVLPATTVWQRPAPKPAVRLVETGISFDDVEMYGDLLRHEVVEAQLRARRVGLT